jgi:hypothetical protein
MRLSFYKSGQLAFGACLLFLIGPLALYAQDVDQPQTNISMQLLSWSDAIEDLWYVDEKNGKTPVFAVSHTRSLDYKYRGARTLSFYGDEVNEEGLPVSVCDAQIPSALGRYIILLRPRSTGRYQAIVIPDDRDSFPVGSYKVFNASRFDIACKMNEEKFALKPAGIRVFTPKIEDDLVVGVQVAFRSDEVDWRLGYSTRWGYRENHRVLVFLYEEAMGDGDSIVRAKRVREIIRDL